MVSRASADDENLVMLPKGEMPNMPMLIMTAEKDKITDTRQTRNWLHQQEFTEFQFKEWANCYHNLFHEGEREEILCIYEILLIMLFEELVI